MVTHGMGSPYRQRTTPSVLRFDMQTMEEDLRTTANVTWWSYLDESTALALVAPDTPLARRKLPTRYRLSVWNAETLEELGPLATVYEGAIAISPDRGWLATAEDSKVTVWQLIQR